jgi:hypothetical protein
VQASRSLTTYTCLCIPPTYVTGPEPLKTTWTSTLSNPDTISVIEIDDDIYQQSILPRLKYNRYRPRFVAIRKAPGLLPPKLLGLALGMVANNANLVYKLLGDCLGVLCAEEENNRGSRRKERKAQELTSEE